MFLNHLKVAIRNFYRQSFFSVINVTGLGVGLAACWLIAVFVIYEKSYDDFVPDHDRIFAVALDIKAGSEEGRTTNTPPPLGLRLAEDFPEVELAARTFSLGNAVVSREAKGGPTVRFNESAAMAVDSTFLKLFQFEVEAGRSTDALNQPGSLVLTKKAAQRYFGDAPALGQTLTVNERPFVVAAVLKDLPATSTLRFDFLLPMRDFKVVENFSWSWIWLQVDTWVKLKKAPQPEALATLEAKFPAMIRRYAPAAYKRIGQDLEKQLAAGDRLDVRLIPLKKLHLDSAGISSRLQTLGDKSHIDAFTGIGIAILLLAWVNFMNLATARSVKRAREVGVRRALGSRRSVLISQFLTESLLSSFIAMLLACLLAAAFLPFFNKLTGLDITLAQLFAGKAFFVVLLLPVVSGMLAGLYPAFYLSKLGTASVSKANFSVSTQAQAGVRSALVVFQFAVSVTLILGSVIIYRQLQYGRKHSPGLNREHVLVIRNARVLETANHQTFRQHMLQSPQVASVTFSSFLPSQGSFGDFYEPEQGTQKEHVTPSLGIGSYLTDSSFIPTLGIHITEGRGFQHDDFGDSTSVILNEAAVKLAGWQHPVGKWLRYPGNDQRFQVIGVMRDFHSESVRTAIQPTALFHYASKTYRTWGSSVAMRIRPGSEKQVIAQAEALWKKFVPNAPFEYDFLDASYDRMYKSETKLGAVFVTFTALAVFIGCLGLFALSAFTAEQRTKEIGIRKVLGASPLALVSLLSGSFLRLVLIAIAVSAPVAWYLMDQWLQNYHYRVTIGWELFVAAGAGALAIALCAVSFQSIKAALSNPIKALRSE